MVEKVIIKPSEVRGRGNIVSPKTLQDLMGYGIVLGSSTDSTYGTVYTGSYKASAFLHVEADSIIPVSDESFTVTGSLLSASTGGSAVSGATVYCQVNDRPLMSATTNSSGAVSFTISCDGSRTYAVTLYYQGGALYGACRDSIVVYQGDIESLDLKATAIIQSGERAGLLATLTDSNGLGVQGQTINFYRTYNPILSLTANPTIIQSGGSSTLTARFKDVVDGSYEPVEGATVNFYRVYTPKLKLSASPSIIQDGGDPTTLTARFTDFEDGSYEPVSGETVKFYRTGKSLVYDTTEYTKTYTAYDNVLKIIDGIEGLYDNDWSFECDFKSDGEARVFVGKTSEIRASNPQKTIGFIGLVPRSSVLYGAYGTRAYSTDGEDATATFTSDTYFHVKMVYDSTNHVMTFYLGDMTTPAGTKDIATATFSLVEDWGIGLVCWSSSTSVSVKNLKLTINEEE